jgi:hypothetical protein
VQDSWIDNFDPRSPLVAAERIFNRSFWGSYRFDVVFAGPGREFFWTPQGVALLEDFDRLVRSAPHVGGWLGPLQFFEIGARAQGHGLPVSKLPALEVQRTGAMIEVLAIRVSLRQYLTADQSAARVRLFPAPTTPGGASCAPGSSGGCPLSPPAAAPGPTFRGTCRWASRWWDRSSATSSARSAGPPRRSR